MANSTDLLNIELLLEDYLEQIRQSTTNQKIEVDTTELMKAINRLPLMPSPEQIAQAIAKVVPIPQPIDPTPTLTQVLEAVVSLKTTMREVGGRGGGGGPSVVGLNASTTTHFQDIKRGITDYETRLDYGARTDDQPVYVGRAPQGTATTDTDWYIERITYDGSNRPTRSERLSGSWDNRGSL